MGAFSPDSLMRLVRAGWSPGLEQPQAAFLVPEENRTGVEKGHFSQLI